MGAMYVILHHYKSKVVMRFVEVCGKKSIYICCYLIGLLIIVGCQAQAYCIAIAALDSRVHGRDVDRISPVHYVPINASVRITCSP